MCRMLLWALWELRVWTRHGFWPRGSYIFFKKDKSHKYCYRHRWYAKEIKEKKKYFKLRALRELHRISGIELSLKKKQYCFYMIGESVFFSEISQNSRKGIFITVNTVWVSQKQRVNTWCWGAGPLVYTALNHFLQTATGDHHFTIPKVRKQSQIQINQHYFLACTTLHILRSSQINCILSMLK